MTDKILKAAVIDRLLSQKEVERLTGLSSSSLEQYRKIPGKGPAWVRIGTRKIGYRESAVVAYLNSLTNGEAA